MTTKAVSGGKVRAMAVLTVLSFVFVSFGALGTGTAGAVTISDETSLAAKFAPTLQFAQSERTYPCNVDFFVSRCNLNVSSGTSQALVAAKGTFTPVNLASYTGSTYYLDNTIGTINDDRIIHDYQNNPDEWTRTVYWHIGTSGSSTYIQYWMFYVFNEGTLNNHEGDWEMVQVVLGPTLQAESVGFSQHNNGVSAAWSDVEKSGESITSYVAKGSHANYLRSYQGKLGFAQDVVDSGGKRLTANDYTLVRLDDSLGWTGFAGMWGNWGDPSDSFVGQRGPPGPEFRVSATGSSMWEGLAWQASISSLNKDMLMLELLFSYIWLIFIVLLAIPVVFMLNRVYSRSKRHELKRPYIELVNLRGSTLRKAANILAIVGIVVGLVSAFFPYYSASANVQSSTLNTKGYVDIFSIDGWNGVRINTLDPDMGVAQLTVIPIPFGVLILAMVVLFVIGLTAVDDRKVRRRYMGRGIRLMVPLILTILAVMSIESILPYVNPVPNSTYAMDVLGTMAHSPLGGVSNSFAYPPFGSVQLRWGIGIGLIFMVLAGVLLIAGGLLHGYSVRQEGGRTPAQAETGMTEPAGDGTGRK
jgi:hypothetical protein